jgi:hypothetical protein
MSDESCIDVYRNMNPENESRKALQQTLLAGIVQQHCKKLYALGSFLKLYRQSHVNTYGATD